MRLGTTEKNAIVQAILDDVPVRDFQAEITKLILADQEAQLKDKAPEVLAFLKSKHGDRLDMGNFYPAGYDLKRRKSKETVRFVSSWYRDAKRDFVSLHTIQVLKDFKLSQEASFELAELIHEANEVNAKGKAMRERLEATIKPCNTTKAARERMSEFEAYIPKDEPKTAYPVAVIGLMDELLKMGWPKGGKVEAVGAAA